MASFGYTVNSSATTWSTTNSSDSLSFSADGKLIAYADQGKNSVWIISADSGVDVGQVADRAAVLFSPSDSDKIIVQAIGVVQVFKRDFPTGSTWSKVGEDGYSSIQSIAFNSTGTAFFLIEHGNLVQYNDTLTRTNAQAVEGKTSALDCSPDGTTIIRGCTDGAVYRGTWTSPTADVSFDRLNGDGDSQVTVCSWSDDAQWAATGDTKGDVRLWDASRKDNISLSLILPPNTSADRIKKLIFVPDSTGLIILSGSGVFVWDIGQQKYLSDIGLPSSVTNIALDDRNVRIALSTDTGISIYDLKKTTSTDNSNTNTGNNTNNTGTNTGNNTSDDINTDPNLPGGRRRGRGKGKATNVVPDELKEMDITAQVTQTESFRYEGLFFSIYEGVMRVQANTTFQHRVAIKALRAGIDPRTSAEKRQEFESVCYLVDVFFWFIIPQALYEQLKTWYQLTQNNNAETSKIIVTLLGVTCAPEFGGKPAIVTSWMDKGKSCNTGPRMHFEFSQQDFFTNTSRNPRQISTRLSLCTTLQMLSPTFMVSTSSDSFYYLLTFYFKSEISSMAIFVL